MAPKPAAPYQPILGSHQRSIRAIDLLRKIGEVTTPRSVNLARLSASWATRRYFWCIHDFTHPVLNPSFRLSDDARKMERHQKTLLSDEFGVGFAALLMEQIFSASQVVDVEFALSDPTEYFGVGAIGTSKRRPDFLMWAPGGSIYVVECKGCQTSRSGVFNQLRRGMEQVPTIEIPGSVTPQLVIGTYLAGRGTTVYIVDPPSEDQGFDSLKEAAEVERRGPRHFKISDEASFRTKLRRGTNLQYLRWISQHSTAARLETSVGYRAERPPELPNAELTRAETAAGDFVGVNAPLAPEFGYNGPTIFRGVEAGLFARINNGDLEASAAMPGIQLEDPTASIGFDGTCLLIRNLPL